MSKKPNGKGIVCSDVAIKPRAWPVFPLAKVMKFCSSEMSNSGQKKMIAVDGQFPGPLFNATTIHNVVVRVFNHLDEPLLLPWSGPTGIQMRRNLWQDALLGTHFPVPPRWKFTYQFQSDGKWYIQDHRVLRRTLDYGKKLRMPDGVLLNGKGPYKYNSSVPDGIDYLTANG